MSGGAQRQWRLASSIAALLVLGCAGVSTRRAAVVSGGMHLGSEVKGGPDVCIQNLAEQFAERALAFYFRQGWL
jgi:hypothetical protein